MKTKKNKLQIIIRISLLIVLSSHLSCKKFLTADLPIDKINGQTAFSNSGSAVASVNSIYESLTGSFAINGMGGFGTSLTACPEIITGNYSLAPVDNNIKYNSTQWEYFYGDVLIRINDCITGLSKSKTLPEKVRSQLIGETKFVRAWVYFYLVNFYGDVPIVVTTTVNTNRKIPRSSVNDVYTQIIADLTDAENLLSEDYLSGDKSNVSLERVTPNRSAAEALFARVYLYRKNWSMAEKYATMVIDNNRYALVEIDNVFLKNSKEAIWQLQPDNNTSFDGPNARDGEELNPIDPSESHLAVTSRLYDKFESSDLRKSSWFKKVGNEIWPYKYKANKQDFQSREYQMVLRLSEQYLIRSEARAMQNNIVGANSAASDINLIRNRAGLSPTTANNRETLLNEIAKEHQLELFTEYGDWWLDLKRRGELNNYMMAVAESKGYVWNDFYSNWPMPPGEIIRNPALKPTPGYGGNQ